jgi:hypothetical protein
VLVYRVYSASINNISMLLCAVHFIEQTAARCHKVRNNGRILCARVAGAVQKVGLRGASNSPYIRVHNSHGETMLTTY